MAKESLYLATIYIILLSCAPKERKTINTTKIKVLTNDEGEAFTIDGQRLEFVSEYKYLGQSVAFEDRMKDPGYENCYGWKNFW